MHLQLIADILSFDSDLEHLNQQLQCKETKWEKLVEIASSHLVLTTLYCRLKQKNLLKALPKELNNYLFEITSINKNRNLTILKEIKIISSALDDNNINHVFLKGSALLAGNHLSDLGERMIGDIDILVEFNKLEKAFKILTDYGYSKYISFNYKDSNYRHLPRQVSDDKLAAVEIHKHILNKKYQHILDSDVILKNKRKFNGISLPNEEFLLKSIILGSQINNKGLFHNLLNFKYGYDCLLLNSMSNNHLMTNLSNNKYYSNFTGIMNIHFPEIRLLNNKIGVKIRRFFYKLKLNSTLFRTLNYSVKNVILNINQRVTLFVSNKSYRENILRKI